MIGRMLRETYLTSPAVLSSQVSLPTGSRPLQYLVVEKLDVVVVEEVVDAEPLAEALALGGRQGDDLVAFALVDDQVGHRLDRPAEQVAQQHQRLFEPFGHQHQLELGVQRAQPLLQDHVVVEQVRLNAPVPGHRVAAELAALPPVRQQRRALVAHQLHELAQAHVVRVLHAHVAVHGLEKVDRIAHHAIPIETRRKQKL